MRTFFAASVAIAMCISSASTGAQTMPFFPGDRTTTWHLAGMSVKGGVPSASWPTCNSTALLPSGGDDTVPINDAIARCPPGTVVKLGSGTFTIGRGNFVAIDKGVVLRGSGDGITVLKNPLNAMTTTSHDVQAAADPTPIVVIGPSRWPGPDGDAHCMGPTRYQPTSMQLLSTDGIKATNYVLVADGSIFAAGQQVLLDETSGGGWQPDISGVSRLVWASPDYGVVWQVHSPAVGIDDPVQTGLSPSATNNFAGAGSGGDAACWFSRQDRPQNEIKEVASVVGNTVFFTSPLHKNYRKDRFAELTRFTGSNLPVRNAGIENLTVAGGGDGAVRFEAAAYSWAKDIEVVGWYGEGVALNHSFRVELRDSYIHDAAWAEPGGAGYAISIASGSSELLIENNIAVKANKVMVARSSGTASVVGYNYMDDGYIATAESWQEIGLNASHMVGSHHVLFEGNQSFNMDSDETHGNSTYQTYFRNWATTTRHRFRSDYTGHVIDDTTSSSGPRRAVGATQYTYFMTFVGNVLGETGRTNAASGYVDDYRGSDWGGQGGMMWLLGWNPQPPYRPDPNVAATSIRDGNWDAYLAAQSWLSNPSASATKLPNSLYREVRPAFFGLRPWPWVDPSSGTVQTLPAKARYDVLNPTGL